jgi:hypothetical protein
MLSIYYVTLLAGEILLSILFFHYSLTKKVNRFKILILLLTILKFIFEINRHVNMLYRYHRTNISHYSLFNWQNQHDQRSFEKTDILHFI